jgi:hypothetical protein
MPPTIAECLERAHYCEWYAAQVAELTSQQGGVSRQQVIEQLMQQIMHDGEFRREGTIPAAGSRAKH